MKQSNSIINQWPVVPFSLFKSKYEETFDSRLCTTILTEKEFNSIPTIAIDDIRQEYIECGVQISKSEHTKQPSPPIYIGKEAYLSKEKLRSRTNNKDSNIQERLKNEQSIFDHTYKIDPIDSSWLKAINDERTCFSRVPIEPLVLEQTFFVLERTLAKTKRNSCQSTTLSIQETEDIPCDICLGKDGEDGNEIVFCDGCSICVHQACYGIIDIPKGSWFCSPCEMKVSEPSCILCPVKEGAMKMTDNEKWCHILCALWIPEISFGDVDLLEPVKGYNEIPKARRNLVCSVCKQKNCGASIQCSVKKCYSSYHVTCARKSGYLFQQKIINGVLENKSYCYKHSSKNEQVPGDTDQERLVQNNPEIQERLTPILKYIIENMNMTEIYKSVRRRLLYLFNNQSSEIPLFTVEMLDALYAYWKIRIFLNFGQPLIDILPEFWLEDRPAKNENKEKMYNKKKEIKGKNISMNARNRKSDEENIKPAESKKVMNNKTVGVKKLEPKIDFITSPTKTIKKLSPKKESAFGNVKFVTGNSLVDSLPGKKLIIDQRMRERIRKCLFHTQNEDLAKNRFREIFNNFTRQIPKTTSTVPTSVSISESRKRLPEEEALNEVNIKKRLTQSKINFHNKII